MSSVERVEDIARGRRASSVMASAMKAPGIALLVSAAQSAVIVLVALGTGLAYHGIVYKQSGDIGAFLATGVLAALAYVLPTFVRGHSGWYEAMANRRSMREVAVDWTIAVFAVAVIAFLTKTTDDLSRGSILSLWAVGFLVLAALESIIARLIASALARALVAPRRVMIFGESADNARLAKLLRVRSDVDVVGLRSLPVPAGREDDADVLGGVVEQAVAEARHLGADDIVLTVPLARLDVVERCVQAFSMLPVTIHIAGDELNRRFAGLRVTEVGTLKTLRLNKPALTPVQATTKRLVDIVLSALGLLVLAPLFVLVALLIKFDSSGPVFFLQRRRGYNLRDFRIFKFRTMTTMDDGSVVVQAKRNDPRITRVGAWLRRFNIDELPQLLNVLKGDMSIVGPRPHAIAHDDAFEKRIARYARRLNVRPGITGWAQVNGFRGETDTDDKMARRVEADLEYIDNWSLALDLRILALTVLSPKAYRNAR